MTGGVIIDALNPEDQTCRPYCGCGWAGIATRLYTEARAAYLAHRRAHTQAQARKAKTSKRKAAAA